MGELLVVDDVGDDDADDDDGDDGLATGFPVGSTCAGCEQHSPP